MVTTSVLRKPSARLTCIGGVLVGLHAGIAVLSHRFHFHTPLADLPILTFVGLSLLAGLVYLVSIREVWQSRTFAGRKALLVVLAAGALMRIAFFFSAPVLEDDFYRYLWDGGVLAHAHNPYAWAPERIMSTGEDKAGIPQALSALANRTEHLPDRVNHPYLRTIYPPVAQCAFALVQVIDPWGLQGWRAVLLVTECIVLVLIALLLRQLNMPLVMVAVYWWNPLVIKEIVNSAHMDILALPFVLGALLYALKRRPGVCGGLLGLGTGVKLWPVILLPALFRAFVSRPRQLAAGLAVFLGAALLSLVPFAMAATGENSGLLAYGQRWEMNDALFMLVSWIIEPILSVFNAHVISVQTATRLAVGALLCGFVLWLTRSPTATPRDLAGKVLAIIAALFLLSPTQFPWYAVWFIPFLALTPCLSLLLLTVLLPVYYLRFYFLQLGHVDIFDYGVVWIEFVPVWGLLIWETLKNKYTNATEVQECEKGAS